jgi:cyclopropane-fatty-acyl-phospholipid synthase
MQYSSALFSDAENGVKGDLTHGVVDGDLEAAQERKLHHVLKAVRAKAGDRLLEFGSGWGALAITVWIIHTCLILHPPANAEIDAQAAKHYGCTVDTLTLSVEQKLLAEERIAAEGLSDKITVHLMDYRDLPKHFKGQFDCFVSIEMIEHVGSKVCFPRFTI